MITHNFISDKSRYGFEVFINREKEVIFVAKSFDSDNQELDEIVIEFTLLEMATLAKLLDRFIQGDTH